MANVTEYNDSHAHFIHSPKDVEIVIGIIAGNDFLNELLGLDLMGIEAGEPCQ